MLYAELIQKQCQYLFQHRQDIFLFVYHLLQPINPSPHEAYQNVSMDHNHEKEQQQTNRLNPVGQR